MNQFPSTKHNFFGNLTDYIYAESQVFNSEQFTAYF